jgi:FdhE protein
LNEALDRILEARLPVPARVFAARAARLDALAEGHPAAPFLALLARLARGQEAAVGEVRCGARPGATLETGPEWRAMLRVVLGAVRGLELPGPAQEALARLHAAGEAELDALGAGVLAGHAEDLATAPFVGAALQAQFTASAAGLDAAALPLAQAVCPACGFAAVAATVGGVDRLRYVACGLCATEWHVPRVQCAVCRTTEGISYWELAGAPAGVKAEACGSCRAYLKVFDLQYVPGAEPLADDAATLVLDVLLGEQGWRRAGRNLLAPAGEPTREA